MNEQHQAHCVTSHGARNEISSEALFGDGSSVLIEHAGRWYQLRRCAAGGLQLTGWAGPIPSDLPRVAESPVRLHRPVGLFGRIWLGRLAH